MKTSLVAVAVMLAVASVRPATAGDEALVALAGGGWDRDGRVHDVLTGIYGFAEVRLAVSAAPDELPELVRDFVERPAPPGSRRLVWVSGLDAGREGSPCPPVSTSPWVARAPTLVLAPRCYAEVFRWGPASRHYEIATPDPEAPGASRAGGQAPLAAVRLPGDAARFIERADQIVLARLEAGAATRPADLLAALRWQFGETGSDYTPALLVSAADVAESADLLTAKRRRSAGEADVQAGRRTRLLRSFLELRRSADPTTDAALRLGSVGPVVVLRPNAASTMLFVRAGRGYFGWAKADALE